MLIHSITPHIFLEETPNIPQFSCKTTPFGYISGYDTPDGFCISRIHSTNPADYLKGGFSPGSIYQPAAPTGQPDGQPYL